MFIVLCPDCGGHIECFVKGKNAPKVKCPACGKKHDPNFLQPVRG